MTDQKADKPPKPDPMLKSLIVKRDGIQHIVVHGNVAGSAMVSRGAPAEAQSAEDLAEMLELITRLEEDVANLAEAPAGLRDDAHDELRKAHEAGTRGDTQRLVDKLDTAQGYLARIAATVPAAESLAQTARTLAVRLSGSVA